MSVKKFKFVSPGVFTREIDQSQLPADDSSPGPVIIGRLPQGPAMEPVSIRSFEEFVQVFGEPVPGKANGDVWRAGNYQAPTYAAYAAQAYLKNSTDGITVVRLAGLSSEDNAGDGDAGWTTVAPSTTIDESGGAFGLFICPTGSGQQEGHLAAVWYVHSGGAVALSGALAGESTPAAGVCGLFGTSSDSDASSGPTYRAAIYSDGDEEVFKAEFDFDPSSRSFIRKVFNTNPQTVRGGVTPVTNLKQGEQYYWLGETYESHIQKQIDLGNLSNDSYAVVMPFKLNAKSDYSVDFKAASTGWFLAQDLSEASIFNPANAQRLFKVHALEPGKWVQDNIKVSIQDLQYSRSTSGRNDYSTFTLVLRKSDDTDKNQQVVERFSNLDLNPLSDNYIAKKIGDKKVSWDQDNKVLIEQGDYDNISKYIRIEVVDAVQNGALSPAILPFGVEGPLRYSAVVVNSGSNTITPTTDVLITTAPKTLGTTSKIDQGALTDYTASLNFPEMVLRKSSSAGDLYNQSDAYFGMNSDAYLENETAYSSRQFSPDYSDMVTRLAGDVSDTLTEPMWRFSLDDIRESALAGQAYYESGSRAGGNSISANDGWQAVIDAGWTRFTAPMFGGFDGLDITETEPFNNTGMADATRATDYALNTVRTSIEMINDPEVVDMNMAVIPGITNKNITRVLVETCEERGDAIAIIDLPDVYLPYTEGSAYASTPSRGGVEATARALEAEQIDSSYGCTYFPWVQIQDTATSNNRVWVPPSVAALGTFASSDTQSELWFAPAGFNRGGLSTGAAGLPVLNVSQKLSSRDRDRLYEANINPIASFPNEGIVIFGQKTLQITPSALDRINVRRMMIFVKKQISILSNQVLFDQNVQATWNRFISLVDPFLSSVKNRLGLSEYRLILDETTTTPDVVDQNIMYAKIFIKPAKAIEFIALDFIITNQGASFED